jgi:hypothetical protein
MAHACVDDVQRSALVRSSNYFRFGDKPSRRQELALFAHELLSREIDIRGFAGCRRIPANTQTIEREPAASFKPPPDQYQN